MCKLHSVHKIMHCIHCVILHRGSQIIIHYTVKGQFFAFNLEKITPGRKNLHRHRLWCLWQIWGMFAILYTLRPRTNGTSDHLNSIPKTPFPKNPPRATQKCFSQPLLCIKTQAWTFREDLFLEPGSTWDSVANILKVLECSYICFWWFQNWWLGNYRKL